MLNIYDSDKFENVFNSTKNYLNNSNKYAVFDNTIELNTNLQYVTQNVYFELNDLINSIENETSIKINNYILKPLLFYTGFDYEKTVCVYGIFNKNNKLVHKIIMLYTLDIDTEQIILAMK